MQELKLCGGREGIEANNIDVVGCNKGRTMVKQFPK
jgi:hypothetical protein